MTPRTIALCVLAGILGLWALVSIFTGSDEPTIRIWHRVRDERATASDRGVAPVAFGFDEKLQLTLVKVVKLEMRVPPAEDSDDDTDAPPGKPAPVVPEDPDVLWCQESSFGSDPIRAFDYGQPIKGMADSSDYPDFVRLTPGERYRLFVETADARGQLDFSTRPVMR